MQPTFDDLCTATTAQLEEIMRRGSAPALELLAGWEYQGYNHGPLAELIRARKFKKGFYFDGRAADTLRGYNVMVRQNGRARPWIPRLERGQPLRYGLYDAYPAPAGADARYPQSLLLNYDCGRNSWFDPSRLLRDYLVQASPETTDLLLGKGYGVVGALRVPLGFFILRRHVKVSG